MITLLVNALGALDRPMATNLLALDQSSRVSGYAIFKDGKLVDYGRLDVSSIIDFGERLTQIRQMVNNLIEIHSINEIIFEDIQYQSNVHNNVQTFKALAEVYGVLYELFTELNIKNQSVLSTVWKSKLGIKGKTRPEQKKNA